MELFKVCITDQEEDPDHLCLYKTLLEGNTRAALQLLTGQDHGGALNLNEPADLSDLECSLHDALSAKHLPAQPLHPECLL